MANKTGILPANGHRIQGRSSEDFLNSDEILNELNLIGTENFMDAGCGDGHIAIKALDYIKEGTVYALDIYEPSVEDMEKYRKENNIENLIPIKSDVREKIDLDDDTLDVVLMVNVFHGFTASRKTAEAIKELKRVIKPEGGRIAIMDYKKQETRHGPPYAVRSSPEELKKEFIKHGLEMTYLNDEIGEEIPEGMSHYFIVFEYKK